MSPFSYNFIHMSSTWLHPKVIHPSTPLFAAHVSILSLISGTNVEQSSLFHHDHLVFIVPCRITQCITPTPRTLQDPLELTVKSLKEGQNLGFVPSFKKKNVLRVHQVSGFVVIVHAFLMVLRWRTNQHRYEVGSNVFYTWYLTYRISYGCLNLTLFSLFPRRMDCILGFDMC